MQKDEIISSLKAEKFSEIIEQAKKGKNIIRKLTSLVYDKEDLICWRAIDAIGLIAGELARTDLDSIRNLSQRFLWMMRDESGNNPGSAPEILGEIVINRPDAFADIVPIIASFHDEKMLRRGVFRAIWRICEKRPDLVLLPKEMLDKNIYLGDDDPVVRAYAVAIAGRLSMTEFINVIDKLRNDQNLIKIYQNRNFIIMKVGDAADLAYSLMTGRN